MRIWLRRRPLLVRTVLLLLAIAMLVQPVLAGVGELHVVEHGTHEATAHGDADHAPHEEDDPAHALGAHALLHQAASAGASDVFSSALPVPTLLLLTVDLPSADVFGPPKTVIGSPFRPPIA